MKLKVIIREGEDGYYVAECPVLEGCISQGRTKEEALENIKEAIEVWLETFYERFLSSRPAGAIEEVVV